MVKTCAASAATSPLTMQPKRRRTLLEKTEPYSAAMLAGKTFKEGMYRVLQELFSASKKGVWCRILPLHNHEPDICYCLGVKWKFLLAVLTYLGLIGSKVSTDVRDYFVIRNI